MMSVSSNIISNYKKFWDGSNTNPVVYITYNKKGKSVSETGLVKPWMEGDHSWIFSRAVIHAHSTGDMSVIKDALDIMEYELSMACYAGDGYPILHLNTGAGCVAAFISEFARFYNDTVWFELDEPWDFDKILALKPDFCSTFSDITLEAISQAAARFKGHAVLSCLDLGGVSDVLASLRRTSGLLYDMSDSTGDVIASLDVIYHIWKNFLDKMCNILEPANKGLYSSWAVVLSDEPYYPSQSDFSAMISPSSFDKIIWPSMSREFSIFDKTLFHLDGSGQIPHLDTLCSHPSLRIVQWIPEPMTRESDKAYFPLYENIIAHGRKIAFKGNYTDTAEILAELFKHFPREAFFMPVISPSYDEAMRVLEVAWN